MMEITEDLVIECLKKLEAKQHEPYETVGAETHEIVDEIIANVPKERVPTSRGGIKKKVLTILKHLEGDKVKKISGTHRRKGKYGPYTREVDLWVLQAPEEERIETAIGAIHLSIERYNRLNQDIFIPLSKYEHTSIPPVFDGGDPWDDLKLIYDISSIRANPLWEEAKKFLQKYLPAVLQAIIDIEELSNNLIGDIGEYRERIETKVKHALSELLDEEGNPVKILDEYDPSKNGIYWHTPDIQTHTVFSVLSEQWIRHYLPYKDKLRLDDTIADTQYLIPFSIREKGIIFYGTHHIATLPSKALRDGLSDCIDQLRKDKLILDDLIKYFGRRDELQRRINEDVREPLSKLITSGKERLQQQQLRELDMWFKDLKEQEKMDTYNLKKRLEWISDIELSEKKIPIAKLLSERLLQYKEPEVLAHVLSILMVLSPKGLKPYSEEIKTIILENIKNEPLSGDLYWYDEVVISGLHLLVRSLGENEEIKFTVLLDIFKETLKVERSIHERDARAQVLSLIPRSFKPDLKKKLLEMYNDPQYERLKKGIKKVIDNFEAFTAR